MILALPHRVSFRTEIPAVYILVHVTTRTMADSYISAAARESGAAAEIVASRKEQK